MSGPDGIDERFGTLVGELRSGEATASPELRERVRAIAKREPEPPGARFRARLPRRTAFVLVPVCALAAVAVAVGVFTSGGSEKTALDRPERASNALAPNPPPFFKPATGSAQLPFTGPADTKRTPGALPPSGTRH